MPYTNKASAPVSVDIPEFEGRYVDLAATPSASRSTRPTSTRPGSSAGCRRTVVSVRTGRVLTGSISFRFAGHTETYAAGDVYYAPAGHTPVMTAGTEVVEFSPAEALNATMTVVGANLAAAGASS